MGVYQGSPHSQWVLGCPPPGDAGDPPAGSLDSVFLFIAAAFFLWLLSV